MKKYLLKISIITILLFSLVGCNSKQTDDNKDTAKESRVNIKIGTLKGPTAMGLVNLMNEEDANYTFDIITAADELSAKIIKGEVDIATVPANLASILYNKTDKQITVLNINTLGVLYVVAKDNNIKSLKDLEGKTIYLTGKGTTPEYAINYLLDAYKVDKDSVKLEFKSEASEVASILSQDEDAIGLLPQPFVTVALSSNENLKMVLNLSQLWDELNLDSSLVTGVTIVRKKFLEDNKEEVDNFLTKHKESSKLANDNVEETSKLVGKYDIVKQQIALKAIPYCNITYIDGNDMKKKLGAYLETLYEQNSQSVGGNLPDEKFYYSH